MQNSDRASLESFASKYRPDFSRESCEPLKPLSGDAGFRRYFRTSSTPPFIAVDSPPLKEKNLAYVQISNLFQSLGVRVPAIFAVDFSSGYFLLEDLGERQLQDHLNGAEADTLYEKAMEQLFLIQSCQQRPQHVPEYDLSLLLMEMQLFPEWFLEKLLGLELREDVSEQIKSAFEILKISALSQPKTLVHRDFHSRNLMCLQGGDLAVIDFQDAVWGPLTYDLASLSRDCYVRWSEQRLHKCIDHYFEQMVEKSVLAASDKDSFRRWFDLMGLQRHLKVLGIFARLSLRDGKHSYLNDLPLVLRYSIEVMRGYSEFSDLADYIESDVIPACQSQDWYRDWRTAVGNREIL